MKSIQEVFVSKETGEIVIAWPSSVFLDMYWFTDGVWWCQQQMTLSQFFEAYEYCGDL